MPTPGLAPTRAGKLQRRVVILREREGEVIGPPNWVNPSGPVAMLQHDISHAEQTVSSAPLCFHSLPLTLPQTAGADKSDKQNFDMEIFGSSQFGKPRKKLADNIKTDLGHTGCDVDGTGSGMVSSGGLCY
jgi:hypothetical protein